MSTVLELARTLDASEVPVAAIIVKDNKIIGQGVNTREKNQSILGHAELNALEEASKSLNSWNLSGATLYVNLEPCAMCAGAIIQAHISEVVFAAYDIKSGALGSRYNISTNNLKITGGILEEESKILLSDFFLSLREKRGY